MTKPKVLIYDIEVTPILGWTYKMWDTNVIRVERDSNIMCFAWKWLGDFKVESSSLPEFKTTYAVDPHNDKMVVEDLWNVLDEADVVVGHNAKAFDNKIANARFLVHGFGPPSTYRTVDTLTVARRYFRFASNTLNNLCDKLELGCKPDATHGKLWRACIDGEMTAWKKMVDYCKEDVRLTERLYKEILPFISTHPNMATLAGLTDGCPKCGSTAYQYRGFAYTTIGTYRRIQCQSCGGWSRERVSTDKGPKLTNA